MLVRHIDLKPYGFEAAQYTVVKNREGKVTRHHFLMNYCLNWIFYELSDGIIKRNSKLAKLTISVNDPAKNCYSRNNTHSLMYERSGCTFHINDCYA